MCDGESTDNKWMGMAMKIKEADKGSFTIGALKSSEVGKNKKTICTYTTNASTTTGDPVEFKAMQM